MSASPAFADPFRELKGSALTQLHIDLLGARITFESNSPRLLELVQWAYADLPQHRLATKLPHLTIKLLLRPDSKLRARKRSEPPPFDMFSGGDWLGAASQASDFVALSPQQRTGLVVVSPQTLAFPYHARYELIEFAVFTLATRCQRLAPLHAACVGFSDRGILLMGASGSGKSTMTMMCLMRGFDLLAEDSVFVQPRTLLATGVSNFLHVRSDSLRWLDQRERAAIRRSPVIRRRSGVKKYEFDLRAGTRRLARSAQKLSAVVFLSGHGTNERALLQPLSSSKLLSMMATEQAYAVSQPEWPQFSGNIAKLPAFELRRGRHPVESVEALRSLLVKP